MKHQTFKTWIGGFFRRGAAQMNRDVLTPLNVRSTFQFRLGELLVGELSVKDGRWKFRYSDEFRGRPEFSPLPIFPDLDETYESQELWPFFKMRVPSLKQPAIRDIITREGIDANDQVQLLRRFGRRTISNPFELVEQPEIPSKPVVVASSTARRFSARPIVLRTPGTNLPVQN